jgi:L-threonylcarbamoyladenylate synthase
MKILPTETPALFDVALAEAARLLVAGEIVALPSETVYGLAANALDPRAVRKIFKAKGRPSFNPLIVHVASLDMARQCVRDWPARASALAAQHWPGPLTLVLPKSEIIPSEVTAGGNTVAIRWPSHPFMQAVIQRCGFPIAAPSANRSNELSPTNAAHVAASLGERVPLIIDGGQCQVGIESTVFDVLENRVLRPGMISAAELNSTAASTATTGALKSPGQLEKHYSPRARLIVARWRNTAEAVQLTSGQSAQTRVIAYEQIPDGSQFASVAVIPDDAEAYARALYAELHQCDQSGAELILVETPPEGASWEGIRDRLRRAAQT